MGRWSDENELHDPELDRRLAGLVGQRLIVGITRVNAGAERVEQYQITGLIVAATAHDGVEIEQDENAGLFHLPADPDAFEAAEPGHYRLRASGRVVVDPDLVTSWTVRSPADG